MRKKIKLYTIFAIIAVLLSVHYAIETAEAPISKKHELLRSESINENIGPNSETYVINFSVKDVEEIDVRLRVDEFDSDDYGKVILTLYNDKNQTVSYDTFYPFEKYLNINYKNPSNGDWYIVLSTKESIGLNTVNIAGNINFFGN